MKNTVEISVVLPTLNEKENISKMIELVINEFKKASVRNYEIIFVDDLSTDGTLEEIKSFSNLNSRIKFISMSRRFGDQECLMAGIKFSRGNSVIMMDADLQHPPRYIPTMLSAWKNGSDVVIMQRKKEGHNSALSRIFEIFFYRLLMMLSFSKIYFRFSGFALIDRKVANVIREFGESEPFLRGLIPFVGFNQKVIEYEEDFRVSGKSKYSILQRLKLALRGLTSFSTGPLVMAIWLGLLILTITIIYTIYVLLKYYFLSITFSPGWLSLFCIIGLLSGIQITLTGILGLYISKTFIQSKNRPNFIFKETNIHE